MSLLAESTGIVTGEAAGKFSFSSPTSTSTDVAPSINSTSHIHTTGAGALSSQRSVAVGVSLLVLGCAAILTIYSGMSTPILLRVAGVVALLSLGCLAFEVANLVKVTDDRRSPLRFLPLGGGALLCLAAVFAAFDIRPSMTISTLSLLGGPALAVGTAILLRGIVARIWGEVDSQRSLVPGFSDIGKAIAEGEVFALSPGVIVPTDARIQRGCCCILERYLSTEPHFRVKEEGDILFAGSYVLSGEAEVQALVGSFDSCLRRLEVAVLPGLRWVEDSITRDHENYVQALSYVLLFCAVSSAIFWDERGAAPATILLSSGSILLTAMLGQVGESLYALRSKLVRSWAQRGVLINSAKAWTELSSIRSVAVDPSRLGPSTSCFVKELTLLDDRISKEALCSCIGAILGRAEDRILSTIGDYCQVNVGSIAADRVVNLREYPGRGICGSIKGVEFSIGTEDLLVDRGILIQPSEMVLDNDSNEQLVLIAIGDDVVGRIWMGFGQLDKVSDDAISRWPKRLEGRIVDPSERELSADTLLVRGDESDEVGRVHSPEVALFKADMPEVPASSVVTLTAAIEMIPMVVSDCRRHVGEVLRARAWVLFATFVSVCLIFAGVVTPLVPVVALPVVVLAIFL